MAAGYFEECVYVVELIRDILGTPFCAALSGLIALPGPKAERGSMTGRMIPYYLIAVSFYLLHPPYNSIDHMQSSFWKSV